MFIFYCSSGPPKKTKPDEKSRTCSFCERVFSTIKGLETHIKVNHLKIKRFSCDICGFGALLKTPLKIHMKKHIDIKLRRILTCLHCLNVFCDLNNRKAHHNRSHKDKGFNECYCGKDFQSTKELEDHLKNYHSISDRIGIISLYFNLLTLKLIIILISMQDPTKTIAPENRGKQECLICGKYYVKLKTHYKSMQ